MPLLLVRVLAVSVVRVEDQKLAHRLRLALNILLMLCGLRKLVEGVTRHRSCSLYSPGKHIIIYLLIVLTSFVIRAHSNETALQVCDARDSLKLFLISDLVLFRAAGPGGVGIGACRRGEQLRLAQILTIGTKLMDQVQDSHTTQEVSELHAPVHM